MNDSEKMDSSSVSKNGGRGGSSSNMTLLMAFTAFGTTAAMLAISLPLLQTDWMGRKYLLSDRTLQHKRNAQYQYRWKHALEKTLYYLYHVYFVEYQQQQLQQPIIEWYATDDELNNFLKQILDSKQPSPRLLWIGLDVDHDDPRGEFYVYLLQQQPNQQQRGCGHIIIKVPLVAFGLKLYESMERQITTTALCFVADASSGLGTRWITGLLEATHAGVVLFKEPFWMATLAFLAQQRLVSMEKLQKILFGLCRLEVWRARDQIGDAKTAVFTLPGQGSVQILLPMVQAAFPEDRHVFCYDGCVASVERAAALPVSSLPQPSRQEELPCLDAVLQWNYHPLVSIGTPMHPSKLPNSLNNFTQASRKLPLHLSSAVHAWMDSVDTFLQMKTSSNRSNQYLPYVCKMSLLFTATATSSSSTQSSGDTSSPPPSQDCMYSLSSLLQYITGYHHRSRPLPTHVWEAAIEYWRNNNINNSHHGMNVPLRVVRLSTTDRRAVEDCVFRHKSILIGDKTLPDTVLPAQHWTLKQASKKSSCACCAPEEGEEDENDENGNVNNSSSPFSLRATNVATSEFGNELDADNGGTTSSVATSTSNITGLVQRRPKYVDGKVGFAFDPTAFSNR